MSSLSLVQREIEGFEGTSSEEEEEEEEEEYSETVMEEENEEGEEAARFSRRERVLQRISLNVADGLLSRFDVQNCNC